MKLAVALFADRVTMAGVEDAYKSKTKWERWMWYVTIVAASIFTILAALDVAKKYLHPQQVYDYYPIANDQPPFPNVSLCAPFTMNKTKFLRYLVIPNRTRNVIKRKNLQLQEVLDYTLEFWRYDQHARIIKNQLVDQLSYEIMKASIGQFANGYAELIEMTTPDCPDVLTNCSFHGESFDCCQDAQRIWTFDMTCFQIDVSKIIF